MAPNMMGEGNMASSERDTTWTAIDKALSLTSTHLRHTRIELETTSGSHLRATRTFPILPVDPSTDNTIITPMKKKNFFWQPGASHHPDTASSTGMSDSLLDNNKLGDWPTSFFSQLYFFNSKALR